MNMFSLRSQDRRQPSHWTRYQSPAGRRGRNLHHGLHPDPLLLDIPLLRLPLLTQTSPQSHRAYLRTARRGSNATSELHTAYANYSTGRGERSPSSVRNVVPAGFRAREIVLRDKRGEPRDSHVWRNFREFCEN